MRVARLTGCAATATTHFHGSEKGDTAMTSAAASRSDPDAAAPRLLRLPAVLAVTGLSRSGLYADTSFPRAVKIGPRAVAWVQGEVDAWCAERIAARDTETTA